MRIIKLGFISLIVFAVIIFFTSLLFPSQVRVSRAINIHGNNINKKISDLSSWKQWNELYNDSVKITMPSSKPNFIETVWSYKNNNVSSNFTFETSADITVVQWYFDFKLKWYPWEKFGSILFDKQFGPPMERSLNNLKKLVENSP